jgi:hypothetical protein
VAKTLGPTANRGLGFWAQQPIILSQQYPFNQYDWPTPQVTLKYDPWVTSYNFALLNPPFVDTTLEVRAPHFTPPRAPDRLAYDIPPNLTILLSFGMPFSQYDWPTPKAHPEPATRTWTWSYNLNLIGKDKLPVGSRVYDLPIPIPSVDHSFINPSNINLYAPPPFVDTTHEFRAPHFTPPRAPQRLDYDIPPNLAVRFITPQNPFYQTNWPVNFGPIQPLRSWTWSYNLNLIGQDQLPVGKQFTDLPPRDYERSNALRTWVLNLQQTTLQPLPVGMQIYALPPTGFEYRPLRSWTWSYNLNLIGRDVLPTGKQVFDLPPRGYPEPATRTWTNWYNLNLIGQDKLPAGTQRYELPQPPIWPQENRTWTASYNLNLIGQDQLPVGQQSTALPPTGYITPNQVRTWIQSTNFALLQVQLPFNQYDWPNPKIPQQPAQTWTNSYNLNLIGKDQLPIGKQSFDLPPTAQLYYSSNRTWINNVNLSLLTRLYPFNQYDWPISGGWLTQQRLPAQTWTNSYNLNLIGKDKLPFNQHDWPIPGEWLFRQRLPTKDFTYGPIPRPITNLPKGQQFYELPAAYAVRYREPDRSYIAPYNPNLFPVPPPIPIFVAPERPWVRDYWDCDEWGNLYPGSGIRRG